MNGGTCIRGEICQCLNGFEGNWCETGKLVLRVTRLCSDRKHSYIASYRGNIDISLVCHLK